MLPCVLVSSTVELFCQGIDADLVIQQSTVMPAAYIADKAEVPHEFVVNQVIGVSVGPEGIHPAGIDIEREVLGFLRVAGKMRL